MKHAEAIGQRIKALRKLKGWNQERLSIECGWDSQGRISNYERGIRSPNYDDAIQLSMALGVSVDSLIWGNDRPVINEEPDGYDTGSEYVKIPMDRSLYNSEALGGIPLPENVQWPDHFAFSRQWLKLQELNHKDLTCFLVSGDSMEGRIHSGDVVLIDTANQEIENGKVYAIRYKGIAMIKRLYRQDFGDVLMTSDNKPLHQDRLASPEDIDVAGRVVWVGGKVD